MGLQIEDGSGTGILTKVNEGGRLRAISIAGTVSSHVSIATDQGGVFTAIGTATIAGAGTYYPLFIQNTDPNFILVVDDAIVEVVGTTGGTNIPSTGDYFSVLFNATYTSGGTPITPINLNRTSTKVANVTAYNNNPTLGVGSVLESRRWYPEANGVAFKITPARADDTILGRSNTYTIRYITATTAGTILASIKFNMMTTDDLP